MEELVKRLSIPIPTWILRRRIRIRCQIHKNTNKSRIYIDALDPDIPYTIFKSIQLITNGQIEQQFNEEPFIIELSNENLHSISIISMSNILQKKNNFIFSTIHLHVNGKEQLMRTSFHCFLIIFFPVKTTDLKD